MSHEAKTLWRCDRCSRAETTDGEQPADWRVMHLLDTTRQWELCKGCSTEAIRFLEPRDQPDVRVPH
jgi:hypothetical protein